MAIRNKIVAKEKNEHINLCTALNRVNKETSIWRCGNNAMKSELENIIELLIKYVENDIKIPKFLWDASK